MDGLLSELRALTTAMQKQNQLLEQVVSMLLSQALESEEEESEGLKTLDTM